MATLKSLLPKTVYIISNDPSASFFVISLSALVICCPLLALYISKANEVSDIDTVKVKTIMYARIYHCDD